MTTKKIFVSMACGMLLLVGSNARAQTVSLNGGVLYGNASSYGTYDVAEIASNYSKWVLYYDADGLLGMEEHNVGTRITYDIYNNNSTPVTGFVVGVDSFAGDNAIAGQMKSSAGWSAEVVYKDSWSDDVKRYISMSSISFDNYDYVYFAHAYKQMFEPGNPDYSPAGDPIAAFTGVVDEFSFAFTDGVTGSPVILVSADADGNELVFGGESHHGPVSPVPLPGAVLLFGSGLLGIVGSRLRKSRHE